VCVCVCVCVCERMWESVDESVGHIKKCICLLL
jgi:hypothetical protein